MPPHCREHDVADVDETRTSKVCPRLLPDGSRCHCELKMARMKAWDATHKHIHRAALGTTASDLEKHIISARNAKLHEAAQSSAPLQPGAKAVVGEAAEGGSIRSEQSASSWPGTDSCCAADWLAGWYPLPPEVPEWVRPLRRKGLHYVLRCPGCGTLYTRDKASGLSIDHVYEAERTTGVRPGPYAKKAPFRDAAAVRRIAHAPG